MIHEFSRIPEGFFGDSGLTATSANHIANLLKIRYEAIENELGSLNFVTEKMSIIGDANEHIMHSSNVLSVDEIKVKLEEISRCKGFIAFLREAIKCKNNLAREIEDYQSDVNIPIPLAPSPVSPLSEIDIVDAMSIGDRVQYLTTEARAATYGMWIHPGGHLDHQRQKAFDCFSEPTKVAQAGRDTVFINRAVAVPMAEIDALMMTLQAEHRKSEAALNGYKHDIELKMRADAQEKLDAYRAQKVEYDKAMDEYQRHLADIAAADQQRRLDRRKEIEALKIIIPNQYRDLYNAVNG